MAETDDTTVEIVDLAEAKPDKHDHGRSEQDTPDKDAESGDEQETPTLALQAILAPPPQAVWNYTRTHRLSKLAGELVAAIPEFIGMNSALGSQEARYSLLSDETVPGNGQHVTVICDPAIADSRIQAVLNAHDPTTPSAVEADATLTQASIADFKANVLAAKQALGWNNVTKQFNAAGNQWDAMAPAARTTFMRRLILSLEAVVQRFV